MKILTSQVVMREDLYPRIRTSAETVQKYAMDLSVLPPILVNQHNELIDGWHRWTAHKKNEAQEIEVEVFQTASDAHLLELAIEKNSTHGLQLSQDDKQKMARRIYGVTSDKERGEKKKQLAKILSVSDRTIANWLGEIDRKAKDERNERIFDKWLAGWTREEIAESEDLTPPGVGEIWKEFADLQKLSKLSQVIAAFDDDGFERPIYNVWTFAKKTNSVGHFGNSEQRIVENLLYLYTNPFDIVCDPFAGGGSTIDVCKKRLRRYFVSDRKPIVEREKEIRKHDIKDGLPKPPQWQDVKLVYLDPPYWKQAENQYSQDAEDLANMPLEQFRKMLADIVKAYASKLSGGAYIALIIQPTQWKSEKKDLTDHVAHLIRDVDLSIDMRISAPYSTEQYNAQQVEWAKSNKKLLVITREIIVWRIND